VPLAYRYAAQTAKGAPVAGVIFCAGRDDAWYQVRTALGLEPNRVRLDLLESVLWWLRPTPPVRDLIRLYRTLAERKRLGHSIAQGLQDAMEYVDSRRFVSALAIMRHAVYDGVRFSDAMERAGFPATDVQAVRAVQVAGKEAEILVGLAERMEQNEDIRRRIAGILWYPLTVVAAVWGLAWWMLLFIAPRVGEFFRKVSWLDVSLTGGIGAYYDFAAWFADHALLGSVLWAALPLVLWRILRSRAVGRLCDTVPALHAVSMKADLISIWSSIALLSSAGVKPVELFGSIAATARRPDNARRLDEMARIYAGGNYSIAKAVARCGFPKVVQAEIAAAESANNLSEGIRHLIALLRQDLARHIEQLERSAMLGSYGVIGLFLVLFFFITLYPQIVATLSRV